MRKAGAGDARAPGTAPWALATHARGGRLGRFRTTTAHGQIKGAERTLCAEGSFIASVEESADEERLHVQVGDVAFVVTQKALVLVLDADDTTEQARFVIVVPPGIFYGLAFEDAELHAKVEALLRAHASVRGREEVEVKEGSASKAPAEPPAATSDRIAGGVAAAGATAAAALAAGGTSAAAFLRSGASTAVEKGWVSKRDGVEEVSPATREAALLASDAASLSAAAAGAMVGGVSTAVSSLAKSAVDVARESGVLPAAGSAPQSATMAAVAGAGKVGVATASAAFGLLDAAYGAAREVFSGATEATATLVEQRYGAGHASLVRAAGVTAAELSSAASSMRGLTLRSVGNKAARTTAVSLAEPASSS